MADDGVLGEEMLEGALHCVDPLLYEDFSAKLPRCVCTLSCCGARRCVLAGDGRTEKAVSQA